MNYLLFNTQFEELILNGQKPHTIRKHVKGYGCGETIGAHVWRGKPYRSTQRKFAEMEISNIQPVCVSQSWIHIDGEKHTSPDFLNKFALREGFGNWEGLINGPIPWDDLIKYFANGYQLPFHGFLISWLPESVKPITELSQ